MSGARDAPALGLVALGDSITYGHGGMQSGLGSQSWAMWLAEALDMPFTRYAVNGAVAADVVREQLPRLEGRRFAIGCLYVGVNDVRAEGGFEPDAYERDVGVAMRALAAACDRVAILTLPLDVGLPPAGARVVAANAAIERVASATGAVVVDLRDFTGRAWVWADHVHATATGQVEIADRAARALGAPLPSRSVVDAPRPDGWYAYHYGKRAVRERVRAAALVLARRARRRRGPADG